MDNPVVVKRIKGWQIGLGLLAVAVVGLFLVKAFGQDGFFRHAFDRTADGLGWLLDQGAGVGNWIGDGIENGFNSLGRWYEETDFTDYDWTFWD